MVLDLSEVMRCWIYKGSRREETYLYLGAREATDDVPDELLEAMGPLELVMELDLSERRTLAGANPQEVIRQLQQQGYYLQLPPPVDRLGPGRLQ